jgi:hypothetical protein
MRLFLRQPLAALSFPMILSAVPDASDPIPDGAAVDAQHIVDTLPQQTFDDMARIACSICNADMALVLQTEQSRPIVRAQWGVAPARQASFDKAITEGKSIRYNGYPDKRTEKNAESLEASRMLLLSNPNLPSRLRKIMTDPANVIQVEVIEVEDPEFWIKESKDPRYHQ